MMPPAPFPWFGGKSRAAAEVSAAMGAVDCYVEPFADSLGVLLQRSPVAVETVNDTDGHLVNVWRAIAHDPDGVADGVDWPVSEADLVARHCRLVERARGVRERVQADPDWFDTTIAAWWVWGACCWIGSGWCSGRGSWRSDGEHLINSDAGRGVHRQLPHLGNAGQGVHRQLPHLGDAGQGVREWMRALAARIRRVRIACGDWSRVVTPSVTYRHGVCGVLLDPPYPEGWAPDKTYSGSDIAADALWGDVVAWAEPAGERPDMRVVVCGYDGLWRPPAGWTVRRWTARKGYATHDRHRDEVLWCSPRCESAAQPRLFGTSR